MLALRPLRDVLNKRLRPSSEKVALPIAATAAPFLTRGETAG
jgi:hypothetical protein